MSPSSLPDFVRVVWTGKSSPNKSHLRSSFTVRREKVYRALKWLCEHHEDYRHVTIDEERMSTWESTFIVNELLDSMRQVSDPAAEDASKSGFATEDPDVDGVEGDIPLTVSGMLDVNNTTQPTASAMLSQLADLKREITVNVVTGQSILKDFTDATCFTSAFPTLFPYGTSKHIDPRRSQQLSLQE
jgi:hypothetical protein